MNLGNGTNDEGDKVSTTQQASHAPNLDSLLKSNRCDLCPSPKGLSTRTISMDLAGAFNSDSVFLRAMQGFKAVLNLQKAASAAQWVFNNATANDRRVMLVVPQQDFLLIRVC